MKFVIDMNLSPKWAGVLRSGGHEAKHWSDVGRFDAPDVEILNWAGENDHLVFTNDLDFGVIIASTSATYPSVILEPSEQRVVPLHTRPNHLTPFCQRKAENTAGSS